MRIIHTADIHLDSRLSRHLDRDRARSRRNELIRTFKDMVTYAADNQVQAIIIAGDLFDVASISATARDAVISSVQAYPDISFFYLRGNHDADSFVHDVIRSFGELPANLRLFGDDWTSYVLIDDGRDQDSEGVEVVITGAELKADNNQHLVESMSLDQSRFNIVTLHGQDVENASRMDAEIIPIREYKNRGIDYMALGHVHSPKIERLDARGIYSYPGCLEGRGFDECGPRGFNLLTIRRGEGIRPVLECEFIPFARRVIHEINIDVSDIRTNDQVVDSIRALKDSDTGDSAVMEDDMVRAVLVGELDAATELDTVYIEKMLENDYYFVQVKDHTRTRIDYDAYTYDQTLKGEFVRLIRDELSSGRLSADEATEIIKTGVSLLTGEVVSL